MEKKGVLHMNGCLEKELKQSKWIMAPAEFASPVFVRTFSVKNPEKAQLAVSALGFFVVRINGKRVGEEYFLPSASLYHERSMEDLIYPISDQFTYRCYYSVYDVSSYVHLGENLLEIAVGDGWYRQVERIAEGTMAFGQELGVLYALAVDSEQGGQILHSGEGESCRNSEIVYSQLFYGEIYDGRIAKEKQYTWAPVQCRELPDTILMKEDSVPDRVIRRLVPRLIYEAGDCRIYDAGENISGFVSFSSDAGWGEEVHIRFAENLKEGQLDFASTGADYRSPKGKPQIMEDVYIGNGAPHEFAPAFVWHAFRYFEIRGRAENISVQVIHSDTPVTASFESNSEELNWLFETFVRTQLNNMHGGIPSDCPHRERLGYTGDGQVCAPAVMMMLDCQPFYKKWIRDIFDSQDKVSGHVNHTAPFAGGGGGPGGWGCAAITVPYHYYKFYGDTELLTEYYERMKRWIDYLQSRSEEGLVVREEEGGWCLGDWATPEKTVIPEAFVNTCYLIRSLQYLEEIAEVIGRNEDIPMFARLRRNAQEAVVRTYFEESTGSFAGQKQGADAFALWAGMGDERTFRNLVERYRRLGCFDTGFLCTEILCGLLWEGGEEDLVCEMLTSHRPGSFGYMMDAGATTIWEDWLGLASHDHPMFGACAGYLLSSVLGIQQKAGFQEIVIAPKIPTQLKYARGSVQIGAGKISVSWQKEQDNICFEITLPEGVAGEFVWNAGEEACPRVLQGHQIFRVRAV